jgi:Ca-activated chloride channel family protein
MIMASSLVAYLMDISIRSLALAAIATSALGMRNARSAAAQHAVWAMVVCGMLSLLALEPVLPRLPLRVLGASRGQSAALSQDAPTPAGEVTLPFSAPIPYTSRAATARPSLGWREVAGWIYIAVTLVFLARLLTAVWMVRRLLAASIQSSPVFYESISIAVPLTVGWIRPKILLPAEWRTWDSAKLEAVLAHEGAHVRRRDSLVALVAGLNKCLLWFHPLAWWLERRLAFLAEQACDDICLCVLKDRQSYARLLLEMADTVRANEGRRWGQALAMATTSSHIRRRIDSILDETRAISHGLTRSGWGALLLSGVSVIYCAGAVQLEHQRRAATPPNADRPILLAQQQAPAPLRTPPPTNRKPAPRPDPAIVSIPVEVRDPLNRFVTGLGKENFKLFEDGVEQEISQLSNTDMPIAVGFVFYNRLEPSRQAVAQFLMTAELDDEPFLVLLDGHLEPLADLFPTRAEIRKLTFTAPNGNGRIALLDGIHLAMDHLKKATNPRKALLVMSDGGDNISQYTNSEIVDLVRETHAQVHAIGSVDSLAGISLLSQLTEETGGHQFSVNDVTEAPNVAARIGIAVRNQYVLGYIPKNPTRDGKYRSVKVDLVQPRGLPLLRATSRAGYYAPAR